MTDWQKLLLELRSKGMNVKAVAKNIGASEYTLYHLIEGHLDEPKHSVGERIRELHGRLCRASD